MLLLLLVCLAQMLVFLVEFALHCLLLRHQFGSHDGILRGILHPHHRTAIDGRNLQGDMQFTGRGTTDHNRYLQTRQLQFLVRMAVMYASQIPDCDAKLKAAGLAVGSSPAGHADPELVRYCFESLARMGGTGKNPFLKSLHDQWDRGRELTMKQFSSLARAVGEKAAALPEFADVRAKLSEYVPEDPTLVADDPTVPKLLDLFKNVTEWRPVVKKGKRVYDDNAFIDSLSDQFARRHSLTSRQIAALRRVTVLYKKSIPGFDRVADELGLNNSDDGKSSDGGNPE